VASWRPLPNDSATYLADKFKKRVKCRYNQTFGAREWCEMMKVLHDTWLNGRLQNINTIAVNRKSGAQFSPSQVKLNISDAKYFIYKGSFELPYHQDRTLLSSFSCSLVGLLLGGLDHQFRKLQESTVMARYRVSGLHGLERVKDDSIIALQRVWSESLRNFKFEKFGNQIIDCKCVFQIWLREGLLHNHKVLSTVIPRLPIRFNYSTIWNVRTSFLFL